MLRLSGSSTESSDNESELVETKNMGMLPKDPNVGRAAKMANSKSTYLVSFHGYLHVIPTIGLDYVILVLSAAAKRSASSRWLTPSMSLWLDEPH